MPSTFPIARLAHAGSVTTARPAADTASARPAGPGVRLVHAAPGRARLAVPGLYRSARLRETLERRLRATPWVRHASASTLTGHVLVLHRTSETPETVVREVENILGVEGTRRSCVVSGADEAPGPLRSHATVRSVSTQSPSDTAWHTTDVQAVLAELGTSREGGLTRDAAHERLLRLGPNTLSGTPRRSDFEILSGQFATLPVALLGASAVISVATGGLADAVVILGVVAINAAIGFYTERQAERTIASLTASGPRTTTVIRDGQAMRIPLEDVVVGDLLALSAGQYVAADARLVDTERLSVDESALTGESIPAAKHAATLASRVVPVADRANMAYRETLVTGGAGLGVVVATGAATEIGRIQALVSTARPPETPMQRQLDQLGRRLVVLSGAVCGLVFLAGIARGYGFLQMLRTAASLAVAAVPEGLPTVATTTLALGMRRMRSRRALVRRLDAVETLGAVQVICLDKTGTLTQNRMAVIALHTSGQRLELHGDVLRPAAGPPTPTAPSDVRRLLEIGCLCSDSSVNGSRGTETLDGSATENALVQAALTLGVEPTALRAQWPRMRARYRAEGRNHMATLHQGNGTRVVAVKGSPAEVLAMCTQRLQDAAVVPLTAEDREAILRENDLMGGAALRVLGFAYREDPGLTEPEPACLTWVGLAGLADPVREGVPELIRVLHGVGIRTVMITGDQSGTAYAIGRQLGLSGTDRLEILDAGNLDSLEPDVLAALAGKVHVFSRVSPAHKLAIVQALQRAGNVVAMTGDGINDGPALKAADIGIAMGASGTQVARDVAGMVIEDDELGTLTTAVREGRSIYGNIRKSIHYLASTNLSEVAIMMVGVAGGLGEPLNTMQLLWLNLLSDVLPALALAADPADSRVLEHPPRDPRAPIIGRDQLLRFGVECAALSAGTLGAYGYAVGRYGQGPRASTVALATLTFAQMLHACGCRSDERTLLRPAARPPNR